MTRKTSILTPELDAIHLAADDSGAQAGWQVIASHYSVPLAPDRDPLGTRRVRNPIPSIEMVCFALFSLTPSAKSPKESGFLASRPRKMRDPNLKTNPRLNHAKSVT